MERSAKTVGKNLMNGKPCKLGFKAKSGSILPKNQDFCRICDESKVFRNILVFSERRIRETDCAKVQWSSYN